MISVDNLKFGPDGLIPAVVVDHYTKEVLTLAYMNRESLDVTMKKGLTCFYSRSRQKLWLKGESSGNFQHVVDITADCDCDALVVEVVKDGPACHTGEESCFHNPLWQSDTLKQFSYEGLYELIKGRKTSPKEGSYTTYLFEKGIDKILKKVGEESTEVIVAGSIYARCRQYIEPNMQRGMQKECLAASYARVRVLPSKLGEKIGDYGAVVAALV